MEISLGLQGTLDTIFLAQVRFYLRGNSLSSVSLFRARSRGPVSFILNALKVHRNFCLPRVKLTLFPPAWPHYSATGEPISLSSFSPSGEHYPVIMSSAILP